MIFSPLATIFLKKIYLLERECVAKRTQAGGGKGGEREPSSRTPSETEPDSGLIPPP